MGSTSRSKYRSNTGVPVVAAGRGDAVDAGPRCVEVFRALGDPLRFEILRRIVTESGCAGGTG